MKKSPILIIAYGNRLRCDDGLAWRAAQRLSRLNLSSEVEILTVHLLMPELAVRVSQAGTVLFLDAARTAVPGELAARSLQPQPSVSPFTHDWTPGAILALAQQLYGRHAEAYIISLCGECFDHGETLSPKVEQNLPRMVALVGELVKLVEPPSSDAHPL
jgi:hydrogenase maturation protease